MATSEVLVNRRDLPVVDLSSTESQARPSAKQTKSVSDGKPSVHDDSDDDTDNFSMYDEIMDGAEPFELSGGISPVCAHLERGLIATGPDVCTAEEAKAFRNRLHEVGAGAFIFETVTNGIVSAHKLCTAFGIKPPAFMEGGPDSSYYKLLGMAIARELSKRRRLPGYSSMEDAAHLLQKSKNIMVITGAGVRIPCPGCARRVLGVF